MVVVGDPKDASGHFGVASTGKPDERAKEDGMKLGKHVVSVAEKLF
jgi:NAD(P)H dehydrogenase (quinone)